MNIKDVLLNFLKEHPSSFTYIGIGSAPVDIKKLTALTDQIIPNFLSNKNTDVIRIIHFDPHFKNINKNDLNNYFISKDLGLYNYPQDGILTWKTLNNSIEINIVPELFVHAEDGYFLEDVIDLCLLYESHLVVQEYTGKNLYDLFTSLYKKNKNKELFKKKILFDVSYNQDCHCFIDLETYSPVYDNNNDFVNILLFTKEEILGMIGKDKKIDKIIKYHYIEQLKKIETNDIPRFRKKKLGILINYIGCDTANEILRTIKNKVDDIFEVLVALKTIKVNDYIYKNVFDNYSNYKDVYKWFDDYRKCYDII